MQTHAKLPCHIERVSTEVWETSQVHMPMLPRSRMPGYDLHVIRAVAFDELALMLLSWVDQMNLPAGDLRGLMIFRDCIACQLKM